MKDLRAEAVALKEVVADLTLENHLLKKCMIGIGRTTYEITTLLDAGDAARWMQHCHHMPHLSTGMMIEFVVPA